jgi:Ca-activated chloride channel homolog
MSNLHHTTMRTFAALTLLFLTLPALTADYQENISVEMVQVYISAVDFDRRFITDLQPDDLILRENGEVQEILDFTNFSDPATARLEKAPPLTMAFSMDISGSMSGLSKSKVKKIDLAKKAAMELATELQPGDQMTVFGFHHLPKIIVPMTSDATLIKAKLELQKPQPQETALFDSLHIIVEQLKNEPGRKIIVLGSDGNDTSSHIPFETLLENLRASDVTLLAFGMNSMNPKEPDRAYVLQKMAEATGGYAFFPETDNDFPDIMRTIRKVIRSQYSIWYRPLKGGGGLGWNEISITCKRGDVELRYRQGYYSKSSVAHNASK